MNAAALRKMLDLGLTLEQAVELAEVWEAGAALPVADLVADRRRAYDRERKRRVRGKSADMSTGNPADKDVSPTPPSENPSLPKGPLKGPQKVSIPSSEHPEKPLAAKPKPLSVWVAEIWEITPRPGRERSGRPALERALRAVERRGADLAAVKRGVAGYYGTDDATKNGGQFAKGVDTVISSGRWEAFAQDDDPPPDDDPWRRRLLNWTVNAYWNTEWGPKPGKPGYQGPAMEKRAA